MDGPSPWHVKPMERLTLIDFGVGKTNKQNNMSITTKQETITPKWAEEILTRHNDRVAKGEFSQRKIARGVIRKYISDMKAGVWELSPEPIVIDENDDLTDGQHRLEAVHQSGVTIKAMVTYGWPPETIDLINRGRTRSVSEQLHLHGTNNAIIVAAAVNAIIRINYRGNIGSVSYSSTAYILDKMDMRKHIDRMMDIFSTISRPGRVIGPLSWYRTCSPKKADQFAEQLVSLDAEKGSGPNLYAKYMRDRTINDQDTDIRALCSCIRLHDEGGTREQIKPTIQAVEWLADENKKLANAITELIGPRIR